MGLEPPPNIMNPGQIRGKVRTGAKTATKDQERDYLQRFQRLADDPVPLVPEWRGAGPDPFAKTRRKLEKIRKRQSSGRWLKWYARGKSLPAAYANTLLVLRGGKIPSFASMKFQGRDVKFVLRGRGQRDKLIAVHNHDDPSVRLLGFLDEARRRRLVLVSTDSEFFALHPGDDLPPGLVGRILRDADVAVAEVDGEVRCPHVDEPGLQMTYEIEELGTQVRLCRACIEELGGNLSTALERHVLGPKGQLRIVRKTAGRPYEVQPKGKTDDLAALVEGAATDALAKAKDYEGVTDLDLLDWTKESLDQRLDRLAEGFVLVGDRLWLGDFDAVAQAFGESELEKRALQAAFALQPPRLRTREPSVTRLLQGVWERHAAEILDRACGGVVPRRELDELAQRTPVEALPALARRTQTQQRFKDFPRFESLTPRLQLAYDLFKARKTEDLAWFQTRLAAGVQGRDTRSLALALARVFHAASGLEWQYAPHEQEEATFLEPYVREVALSTPSTLEPALAKLAGALGEAPPSPAS